MDNIGKISISYFKPKEKLKYTSNSKKVHISMRKMEQTEAPFLSNMYLF